MSTTATLPLPDKTDEKKKSTPKAPPAATEPPASPEPAILPLRSKDILGPQRGLPSILPTMTTAEAQAKRQEWLPPEIYGGEQVYYRKFRTNEEMVGWVVYSLNRTFTLFVQQDGFPVRMVKSVAYYDHTEPQTGDPMAPFNNNGTFRRTEFNKKLSRLLDVMDKILQLAE